MRTRLMVISVLASLALSCASTPPPPSPSPRLLLHFMDVGEGDAILLQWIGRRPAWILVDAGNPVTGHRELEYIRGAGVTQLDSIIITHPHMDHAGGLFQIAQSVTVSSIHDNGENPWKDGDPNSFYRWYTEFTRQRARYRPLKAGDVLPLGEARLEILWPPAAGFASQYINARSLVIMVLYGQFRALLAGDLIAPAEAALAENRRDISAQVLKAGHHGAEDTGSVEFLEKVAPQVVVISVDHGNVNGYPSSRVVSSMQAMGAMMFRTDRDGDIVLEGFYDGGTSIIRPRTGAAHGGAMPLPGGR